MGRWFCDDANAMTQQKDPLRDLVDSRIGKTLNGKWHLDDLIGVGGMAAVYRATHRNGKRVAVKILHPIFPPETKMRERFLREGYMANRVDHPGAVSVIDDDTSEDGDVFLVMELLEGVSVDELLWRFGGRMPYQHVLGMADQLLDVLVSAHAKNVIHRDIKPANLFVTRDRRVKVLDFGLARLNEPTPTMALTASGMVLGTPAYMAPEQAGARWHLLDHRTDLFAVGAVMFRLLSGRSVHEAPTERERHTMAMSKPAPKLATVVSDIPANVALLVDKALEFDRNNRWPDAATMQKAVRNAMIRLDVSGISGGAPPDPSAVSFAPVHLQPTVAAIPGQTGAPQPPPSTEIEVSLSMIIEPSVEVRVTEASRVLMDQILSQCDIIAEELGKDG